MALMADVSQLRPLASPDRLTDSIVGTARMAFVNFPIISFELMFASTSASSVANRAQIWPDTAKIAADLSPETKYSLAHSSTSPPRLSFARRVGSLDVVVLRAKSLRGRA